MSSSPITERISALVAPICADLGLDLYDCEYNGGQLTVTIDARPEGAPVDLEAPTRLAARIAADSRESARMAAAAELDAADADDDDDDDDEPDGDELVDEAADVAAADDDPPKRGPGITLDVLALATRLISRELDHADPIKGHYTLEVSSPGLERTLRIPAHFHGSIGTEVAIRLRDVSSSERRVHGVLTAAAERDFTVTRPDGTERQIPYEQVDRARTVFTWGPAPKPAKAKAKPKPKAPPRKPSSKQTPTAATDDTTEAPAP